MSICLYKCRYAEEQQQTTRSNGSDEDVKDLKDFYLILILNLKFLEPHIFLAYWANIKKVFIKALLLNMI